MEIQKELIRYTVSSGKRCAVISTETDVIVPDSKPDMAKILEEEAKLDIEGLVERAMATDHFVRLDG